MNTRFAKLTSKIDSANDLTSILTSERRLSVSIIIVIAAIATMIGFAAMLIRRK